MPNILKRFINPKATPYQFPDAKELVTESKAAFLPDFTDDTPAGELSTAETLSDTTSPAVSSLDYAKLQAEAILDSAREEAAELLAQAKQDVQSELELLRATAQDEGFRTGYAEGTAHALEETQAQRVAQAEQLGNDIHRFLDKAHAAQEEFLLQTQGELRDLAIAIAEKIVRVSLKSSGEIITRMITRATEKLRRKEWVHIYIAACDSKSFAQASPTLTAALGGLSDHVKIIPLTDEESGTCMIEMPDEIIDASVSTQIANIRDMLSDSYAQSTGF